MKMTKNENHVNEMINDRQPVSFYFNPIALKLAKNLGKMKIVEFANSIDSYEEAHNELIYLDLNCLSSTL